MAGRRGEAAAMLVLLTIVCVPAARSHPALTSPPRAFPFLTTTSSSPRTHTGVGLRQDGGWSLKDTLLRLDDMLQRHNDYNDVMLESGEEDDQLSRLLYKLQHGDRVREAWFEREAEVSPQLDPRLEATTAHRRKRERRVKSTTLTKAAPKAVTRKKRRTKRS